MDQHKLSIHEYSSSSSSLSPPMKTPPPPSHSSHTSFPIIAIAIIGILATAFLLVSYYIFVIKCCLNWHRIDLLGRFSFSRRRTAQDPSTLYNSPVAEIRAGLDEPAIRSIPIFEFKKSTYESSSETKPPPECSVCLNEFQEDEKLRIIPNCGHFFHIDCIDVWLQNNANCPVCRTSVSACRPTRPDHINLPLHPILDPIPGPSSPQENFSGRAEEDFVVIEIRSGPGHPYPSLLRINQENELLSMQKKKKIKSKKLSIGDEFIDYSREKDEQFAVVQPIRRSFSMDSASDAKLYLAVQEIIQQKRQLSISPSEDCRVKRSFFSFGQGRCSRSAVQPVSLDPN